MNNQIAYPYEEEYNAQFQEVAALLVGAQAYVADLQQKLVNIHPHTTQGRLERVQQYFWNDYLNDEN